MQMPSIYALLVIHGWAVENAHQQRIEGVTLCEEAAKKRSSGVRPGSLCFHDLYSVHELRRKLQGALGMVDASKFSLYTRLDLQNMQLWKTRLVIEHEQHGNRPEAFRLFDDQRGLPRDSCIT